MTRGTSRPPVIDGFEHLGELGGGGYADVYLYEQDRPKRRVAIKVMRTDIGGASGAAQFTSEANLMAAVSTHPYIVSIFGAEVAKDGRPYLVLEYYPGDNLSVRCRRRPLSVAEALRIGVQVAGAVETAHLAGIMHRDIKPANILTSAYGKPGLTDFGISSVTTDDAGAEGMSIPWSPPELLDDSGTADQRSDLWSLAATIYTLLTGRSPFEVPGGDNSTLALMARISHQPLAPTGRDDVPPSLERALATAMSKRPEDRPSSVSAFARSLQAVERELRLQPTDLDVPDDSHGALPLITDLDDLGDATRLRTPRSVEAQRTAPATDTADATRLRSTPAIEPVDATRLRSAPVAHVPSTREEPPAGGKGAIGAHAAEPARPSSRRAIAIAVGAVVALAAMGGAVLAATANQAPANAPSDPDVVAANPIDALPAAPPPTYSGVALLNEGSVRVLRVSWPELGAAGGTYRCTLVTPDGLAIGKDIIGTSNGCDLPAPGLEVVCAKLANLGVAGRQSVSRPVFTECKP
jgi:serine/threonine protein kinase